MGRLIQTLPVNNAKHARVISVERSVDPDLPGYVLWQGSQMIYLAPGQAHLLRETLNRLDV